MDVRTIPPDDIEDAYIDADRPTRQAVSLLLEDDSVRWWLGTINGNRLEGAETRQDHIGYGMYKGEPRMFPQVVAASLTPFTPQNPAYELMESSIAVWIVMNGGDVALKRMIDKVQEILDK